MESHYFVLLVEEGLPLLNLRGYAFGRDKPSPTERVLLRLWVNSWLGRRNPHCIRDISVIRG
jgi:hypothetical protein